MIRKRTLLVFDFDGLLVNSYSLIRETMAAFGLDVGDEDRFKNRRKFLKYFGGGKELLNNLVNFALPKTRKLRAQLTECYRESGAVYPEFLPLLNAAIANPTVHCGILSRNYTLEPGPTMRAVLKRSGVAEDDLDFVIPIPVGIGKTDVLAGLWSSRYFDAVLCGDEIGDYHAAVSAHYAPLIGSYGFDTRNRLIKHGELPAEVIHDSPAELTEALTGYLTNVTRRMERAA
jgi:phosphoglycolate phosphatase